MNKAALTQAVKESALDLGFDLVGVCRPEPPPHFDIYSRWIEEGHHAGMGYLARESALQARENPLQLLPECQSILVVAKQYLPHNIEALQHEDWSISAYAAGQDYHLLIKKKLEQLAENIQATAGRSLPFRTYTDTGPILEKVYARQAGLGWIGKNSCLINPQMGSYLFLGEILLGLPLQPDKPFEFDFCGKCSACREACPASCILSDRTLDAGRCISYLTIEHRGTIPPEHHASIGSWLFGCDVCQTVCPWNKRFAHPTAEPAFQIRDSYWSMDLQSLLRMDRESFRMIFHDSPIQRTKLEGILRNTLILAGSHPDEALVPLLHRHLLHNQSSILRQHAAWSLGHYPFPAVEEILKAANRFETDPAVRQAIYTALQIRQK
ncbi:MAG: tRNA epoxyqueuosine(34) reductase QueG [Anaerolineales bacterium]|nr:tRNA epoxyqueuosine(34) reductase QueG [Anaerolineales bacterium]